MEQEKIKAYYQMWSEAWQLLRLWLKDLENTDDFWQRVMREAESFGEKYEGTDLERFAYIVIIDIAHELEDAAAVKRHVKFPSRNT